MANYDDDDLNDYSDGEEFIEDNLDDAEYDKLYKQLPILKQELSLYNNDIEEIDLKEALYYNYYDIADSVKELKGKYPKKKSMYHSEFIVERGALSSRYILQKDRRGLLLSLDMVFYRLHLEESIILMGSSWTYYPFVLLL